MWKGETWHGRGQETKRKAHSIIKDQLLSNICKYMKKIRLIKIDCQLDMKVCIHHLLRLKVGDNYFCPEECTVKYKWDFQQHHESKQ